MKIMTVVGARPQFIKAAVLSRLVRSSPSTAGATEEIIHTGQHYDDNMSEVFFRELGIPEPAVNLGIGDASHGAMIGRMIMRLETEMLERKPDLVVLYGDTNSTLAGAITAARLKIPIGHVEAGLRSYDRDMPEEQNRVVTDRLSTLLFCPTERARGNLQQEGMRDGVHMVGDIMYDALLHYRAAAHTPSSQVAPFLRRLKGDGFYLLTLHRAENTDSSERLHSIVRAINAQKDIRCVFPVHPRTRKVLASQNLSLGDHVTTLDPLGYLDMIALEDACDFVATDSGGVQKEAYLLWKPCVTLRESTEWVETVESGWNTLAGSDEARIADSLRSIRRPAEHPDFYGKGNAGALILDLLLRLAGTG